MLEYAVALTGSIATGKSTASAILRLFGFRIIDADEVAHQILDAKSDKIAQIFGDEFVRSGKVDRKALGKVVFANPQKRKILEELLHPAIKDEILFQAETQEKFKKPYLIDIPLFFERKIYKDLIKKVVVVYTPKDLQLERLINRDKITKDEAMQKISLQIDIDKKRELATWVIDNSKNLRELQKECEAVKEKILSSF
jgi:dephospho-CoA kinase